jgi:penicillin amidase
MKILKRSAFIFVSLVILVIVFMLVYTHRLSHRAVPDYNETLHIDGLDNEVNVYRDMYGIPHIYANNENDLYLVTGYIMAQERMWQMDLLRRVTQGRLSEIFGDDYIETDLLLRSLEYSKKSVEILENSEPKLIRALESFSAGVNFYISNNREKYPLEFTLLGYAPEEWEAYQSLNLIGYMAWDLKSGWGELVLQNISNQVDSIRYMQLLPDMTRAQAVVFDSATSALMTGNKITLLAKLEAMGLDILSGSNNWAIGGSKSVTSTPLLANDMHLSLSIPGAWMQIHQVIENELNVEGLALPGQPLIIVGHNDSIAWGMTNTYVDNVDFYEEKINPEDSNEYLFADTWLKIKVSEEKIRSKGGKIHTRYNRFTRHGPVVSDFRKVKDKMLSLRWVGQEESNELRSIYYVNRANNWNDFTNAFSTFRAISQNIVYADVDGNIGLYCCAGIPVRKRDELYTILPGWTGEYDWQGMVPFDELPYEYNPTRGFVSSGNNKPVDTSYPYHIGIWYAQPYRINRIRELLSSKEKLSIDDFKNIQNDQVSEFSDLFMTALFPSVLKFENFNEIERQSVEILKKWNYSMDKDEVAASICELWSAFFVKLSLEDELGKELFEEYLNVVSLPRTALYNILNNPGSPWFDDIGTPETEGIDDIGVKSFRLAIQELAANFGNDPVKWKWGKLHQLTLKHPLAKVDALDKIFKLNRGPFQTGGSYHTVSPYSYPWFNPHEVNHGASHRNIYDLSDWNRSCSVIPTGNSGIPASRFYCDQTEMYISGDYHPDWFTKDSVLSATVYRSVYQP